MRRLAPLPFVLLAVLALAPPAGAQPGGVRLRLTDQHPFASPRHPLRLSVEAKNTGATAIRRLSMSVSLYHPATSRSELRRSLETDPVVAQVLVFPVGVSGFLAPGETRTFVVNRALPELTGRDESALYPMKVQLESDGLPVSTLRSALVFIRERPLVPLNVSVTLVLDEGMALRAGGAFADDRLERALAPGGRLEAMVGGLERAPIQATVAISPFLLEQLRRMSTGYRVLDGRTARREGADSLGAWRAEAMLERLRALARDPDVEILAQPLTTPSIPALVEAGLTRDLRTQLLEGREMVGRLLPGTDPGAGLLRPPGSLLTARAVRELARDDVEGLIVDADTLRPAAPTSLTGPAVASVPAGRRRRIRAVVPDTAAMELAVGEAADPVLQSQTVIAELSAIFFEAPGTDRGVALVFGERRTPRPEVLSRLLLQLRRSSSGVSPRGWLRPVKASRLIAGPGTTRRSLAPVDAATYGSAFRTELRAARNSLLELSSVAQETAPLVATLRLQMLVAEAREFLDRQGSGIAFLRGVQRRVDRELGKVQPPAGNSAITLTSRRGVIPVTISSTADYPVHLRVSLLSPRLRFPEGSTRRVILDRPRQALTFPVLAQTTGRFPVRVVIATPKGGTIAESRIVVRSTAYNTRALLVTGVATLFLVFLWVRRLLSTRT